MVSRITEKVVGELAEGAARARDVIYPVIFVDAIRMWKSVTGMFVIPHSLS